MEGGRGEGFVIADMREFLREYANERIRGRFEKIQIAMMRITVFLSLFSKSFFGIGFFPDDDSWKRSLRREREENHEIT